MSDYLDRSGLLSLGFDENDADHLLRLTCLTGHDNLPVVESERLAELLEMLGAQGGNE
jgi:hypothetical protein